MSSCGNDADSSAAVEGRAEAIMSPTSDDETRSDHMMITCPSCNHPFKLHGQCQIHKLSGLLAGVKFDPTDREILEYLEAKIKEGVTGLHPLINEFIPTIEGDSGICYTHPEMLPGMTRDGQIRHFFHRTSKAHKTGTRKLRKVHTGANNQGTSRWHRTGRIKPVLIDGNVKGFKKIFVLRTNLSRQSKVEKTTWVMHQYHLGDDKEEKDGEFVISKVFYQTQTMQCETKNDDKEMEATSSSTNGQSLLGKRLLEGSSSHNQTEGCPESISCDQDGGERTGLVTLQLFPIPALERDDES